MLKLLECYVRVRSTYARICFNRYKYWKKIAANKEPPAWCRRDTGTDNSQKCL